MSHRKRKAKMSRPSRKAALVIAGVKQAAIAQQLKVSPAAVSMVVNNKIRSERIEKAIDAAVASPRTKSPHRKAA